MATLFFQRVLALPEVLEANTLYMVRSEGSNHVEFYVTGNDVSEVRNIITGKEIDDQITAALTSLEEEGVSKLSEARTIELNGDASVSFSFDGSEDVVAELTLKNTGVEAGEHAVVTVDAKGRVTGGRELSQDDIPALDPSKIEAGTLEGVDTTGNAATATKLKEAITINGVSFDGSEDIVIYATDEVERIAVSEKGVAKGVATLDDQGRVPTSQLPSYVDDVMEFDSLEEFPEDGERDKIYVAIDTGNIYRWSGSAYIRINDAVSSSEVAKKLAVKRTLRGVGDAAFSGQFDGDEDVEFQVTLSDTGVEAGQYTVVTVDAKGRVTEARELSAEDIPTLDPAKISAGTLEDVDTTGNAATATKAQEAGSLTLVAAEW